MARPKRNSGQLELPTGVLEPFCEELIASCTKCRRLITVARFHDGKQIEWDPSHTERRLIRSLVGIAQAQAQGFGAGWCRRHVCPDQGQLALEAQVQAPSQAQNQGGSP